jgi:hypothetical protein
VRHRRRPRLPLIQLNVLADNAARRFYDRAGFHHRRDCLTYAIAGSAMSDLTAAGGAASAPVPGKVGR